MLIKGGLDADTSLFGEERKTELYTTEIQIDKFILKLIKQVKERKIPIFDICNGIQIINVDYNCAFYQDLKYVGLDTNAHMQKPNNICLISLLYFFL